jgi:hypothetical protein
MKRPILSPQARNPQTDGLEKLAGVHASKRASRLARPLSRPHEHGAGSDLLSRWQNQVDSAPHRLSPSRSAASCRRRLRPTPTPLAFLHSPLLPPRLPASGLPSLARVLFSSAPASAPLTPSTFPFRLQLPRLRSQLQVFISVAMLDPKWTGTDLDRRDMRTLNLEQVVRRNFGKLAMFGKRLPLQSNSLLSNRLRQYTIGDMGSPCRVRSCFLQHLNSLGVAANVLLPGPSASRSQTVALPACSGTTVSPLLASASSTLA